MASRVVQREERSEGERKVTDEVWLRAEVG